MFANVGLKTKKQSILLNCGYGRSFTVKEVVSSMKTVSGIDFKVFHSDRRAGDIVSSCSDTTLLQKSLNWSPMFNDLDEICKSAFQWEKSPKY